LAYAATKRPRLPLEWCLRTCREESPQQVLAERSGAHVSQIRRYEAGTSQPTLDVLRNLALALNTSADSLLFNPEDR
jgi:transcriptional regulator with XRE-family HTH domain